MVNSDDQLFRMRTEELMDNDVRVPVAMVSAPDGASLLQDAASQQGRPLEARLIGSRACLEQEELELRRDR